jgi:hypothetical protein
MAQLAANGLFTSLSKRAGTKSDALLGWLKAYSTEAARNDRAAPVRQLPKTSTAGGVLSD